MPRSARTSRQAGALLLKWVKTGAPVLALLVCGKPSILAQQPARDNPTRAQAPFTGAIRGRVVDAATNRSLPKTRVTLSSDVGATAPVFTDANGNFAFQPLAAGHYTLLAEKTAYARVRYGARSDLDPPIEISIDGTTPVEEVVIHLVKGAAIFGRVYDEFGDPIVGGEISLSTVQFVGSAVGTVPVARPPVLTNDLGQYRVGDLPSGRYYVTIGAGNLGSTAPGTPREWERLAPWGKTFYPGTASISEATPIVLATGEERGAIDFPVRSSPRAQLLINTRNAAPAAMRAGVNPNGPDGQLRMWFFSSDDSAAINGRPLGLSGFGGDLSGFSVPINEAGDWSVLARSGPDKGAIVNFHLSPGDALAVTLDFQQTSTVTGRVVFDGFSTPPPLSSIGIRVNGAGPDEKIPGRFLLPTPVSPAADGTFALANLLGTVSIDAFSSVAGWAVTSVSFAGRDLADDPITLKPGETVNGVQITLTDRAGTISGRALLPDQSPAAGCAVAIFPEDASVPPNARRMRLARADQHGQFSIRSVPAGAYRAAAVLDIDAASWLTRESLQRLRPASSPVTVGSRGQAPVTLACAVGQ